MSVTNETIIEPGGSWVRIPWREVVQYRDLLFLLVRRDFVAKYKQTILGPIWFVLQPLVYTVVFSIVFKRMAGLSTDGYPAMLFYLSGMLAWQYFAQCLESTSSTFVKNAGMFGKVYFPRIVMPLSVVMSNLLAFLLQFLVFLGFLAYYKWFSWAGGMVRPTWSVVFLPLVVLQTAALGLGVGLWMSALGAKYRDFSYIAGFMKQVWMFGTLPLFMSLSEVPVKYQWVLAANPVCPIVTWYRSAFLGAGAVDMGHMALSIGVTMLLLVSGVLVFSRVERTFIDTV